LPLLLLLLLLQILRLIHKAWEALELAGIRDRSLHAARLLLYCDGPPDELSSYSIKWVLSLDTVWFGYSTLAVAQLPRICQGERW
jgi:hypothetical protein